MALPATARQQAPPQCLNCGSTLLGAHCHRCGQPEKSPVRGFSSVFADLLETLFDFESRTFRSLRSLLLNPGRLSREYFSGRRASYVTPLKLYVFASVLALFAIHTSIDSDSDGAAAASPASVEVGSARSDLNAQSATDGRSKYFKFNVDEAPWHATRNPVNVSWTPANVDTWLNQRMAHAERVLARDDAERLVVEALFGALPQTLLLMLPLFALLLKVIYALQKRLYMEHLIVALHSHAFIALALSMLVGLIWLEDWTSTFSGVIASGVSFLIAGCVLWIPTYLLLMQKRVYAQGWPMTLLKYGLVGTVYLAMFSLCLLLALVMGLLSL